MSSSGGGNTPPASPGNDNSAIISVGRRNVIGKMQGFVRRQRTRLELWLEREGLLFGDAALELEFLATALNSRSTRLLSALLFASLFVANMITLSSYTFPSAGGDDPHNETLAKNMYYNTQDYYAVIICLGILSGASGVGAAMLLSTVRV